MRYAGLSLLTGLLVAQTYNHPTTGQQGTYSGGCQVHTCSGTYYDNGGAGGNYSNNINWIYWTFCPNNSTQCLRMQFTSFDVESGCFWGGCSGNPCCYDILRVQNGPAQNGPILWQGCGTTGPGTITSTDASGCLTLRFCSDGSNTRPGWAATARAPARSAAAASPMKTTPTSTSSVLRALAAILAFLYVPVMAQTTTTLLSGGLLVLMTLTYCVLGWELPCDVAMLCIPGMVRAGLPTHAPAWLLDILMLARMSAAMAGWHRSM
jgi:hypothetical protein